MLEVFYFHGDNIGITIGSSLPHALWDYKNRRENSVYGNTIFGVAWTYDQTMGSHRGFTSSVGDFGNAADFGNYNGGYTGIYAGVPEMVQYSLAGAGEIAKFHDDGSDNNDNRGNAKRSYEILKGISPYGGQYRDYLWNSIGMLDAKLDN